MKLLELTNELAQAYPPISEHPGVLGLINVEPLHRLDLRKGLIPNDESGKAPGKSTQSEQK